MSNRQKGLTTLGNTGNTFQDSSNSLSFTSSACNFFITTFISKQLIDGFEPTFIRIPYIYSLAENISNGNFKESIVIHKDLIITTYLIPFQTETIETIATFIIYNNTKTNINWFQIPREFTYNSKEEVSVAISKQLDGSYKGIYNIPASFYTNNINFKDLLFNFTILPNNNETIINSSQEATVSVQPDCTSYTSESDCDTQICTCAWIISSPVAGNCIYAPCS